MLHIWGAGTLGRLVGTQWQLQPGSGSVIGYTKSNQRHSLLSELGIEPRIGSPLEKGSGDLGTLTADDLLLLALPGHQRQLDAINQLSVQSVVPKRVIVVSSTGYYGATTHQVINERTPAGTSDRAQAIAHMETRFQAWCGANGVIIRPGGLYSAERGPFAAFKRRGTLPDKPMGRTLPLIHYEDVATAVTNALTHHSPHPSYVAVTMPSPTRRAFYQAAIDHLGWKIHIPYSKHESPDDVSITYDVSLLRHDLLPTLRYPDWRSLFR